MKRWFQIGGVLLAALSIFNLTKKVFNFGLSPVLQDIVIFYQNVFYPIVEIIFFPITWLFGLILPEILKDIIVIYILIGSALVRSVYRVHDNNDKFFYVFLLAIIWPISLYRIISDMIVKSDNFAARGTFLLLLELVYIVLTVFALFAMNYYSLGLK